MSLRKSKKKTVRKAKRRSAAKKTAPKVKRNYDIHAGNGLYAEAGSLGADGRSDRSQDGF